MRNKIVQMSKYIAYIFFSNLIYGFILYFVFTWLSGFSQLYAFFGNLALIIMGLAVDEYQQKWMLSNKMITDIKQLKNEKDIEKNYRLVRRMIDSFVSFKTVLYIFYVFILIASQIITFNPALVGGNLSNFVLANSYSILPVIAIDMLIKQFSKDRKRMAKASENLEKAFTENQE